MYVKNEFNKCKDSESRAQWEKTGVHVFSIAEAQRTEAQRTETQRTEAESKSDGRAKGILCFGN